ncbi:MAG: hypothetical protein BWZ10_03266 [candidate division BRC1 bacterium ADurb.BinA364]|nr:MAG: hypothetical protein BWZ10_03266 [candidate division BRC1 bacterium ADurb.BinA364]
MPLAFSGAYHLWIGNLYASSNWQPSAPWTGILYGGVPHPNLAPQAESLGEGDVRLAWTPDPYGVWHYQILVFRGGTGYIEPPDGPSAGFGFGLWTFIDYGAAAHAPAKASFADGWARFRLETPGEYWLAIRAVGWLPPYPATDFEQTHIALP